MKIQNFKMLEHVATNLRGIMKDKVKRVELEERLRLRIANAYNVNPDEIVVDLVYNRMADSFDIIVKREKNG